MGNHYKVIEIIDPTSLLINYGAVNGAKLNEKIRVLSVGPEIVDPDTGEVVGTLDNIKEILQITTVYKAFSICNKISVETLSSIFSSITSFNTIGSNVETLNVDPAEISYKTKPDDLVIRVGDPVEVL